MPSSKPLSGRLILDCSSLLPGPFIGKLLADQGAQVIKIENPIHPDRTRDMGGAHIGSAYDDLNGMKEVVFLNLKSQEDRERFHAYVQKAAGLIEGFRPAAKRALGLDGETLHRINPRLCIVSLTGYPEDGPHRDRAGHDLNFSAITGCVSLFHEMPALPLADLFSAYRGAFAMAAALDSVARGGKGVRSVISMTETLVEAQSTLIKEYQVSGRMPEPGNTLFSGCFPCYRLYQCADGRKVSVGAIENKFWVKFCEVIGTPELAGDGMAQGARAAEVIMKIQSVLGGKLWSHWEPLFAEADCCVEPVLNYSEVYSNGV